MGAWLGVVALTQNHDKIDLLDSVNIDDGLIDFVKGLASKRFYDYYKLIRELPTYKISNDLESAIGKAIENLAKSLSVRYIEQRNLTEEESQKIKLFFDSLSFQLNKEQINERYIDLYISDKLSFFKSICSNRGGEVYTPDLNDIILTDLVNFIVNEFDSELKDHLNEQLKRDSKAQVDYFVHILEYAARTLNENQEELNKISTVLNDLINNANRSNETLYNIGHGLQLIRDKQRASELNFKKYVVDNERYQERISKQLEPALILTLSDRYTSLPRDFSYQYVLRYTTFLHRDNEIDKLWQFLNNDNSNKFSWWIVEGPAGVGKSRLSLEFCLQADAVDIYAGFLEVSELENFNWSKWQPDKPTLIIIDYVSSYADDVREMISKLNRNVNNINKPVRVLLLEREIRGNWWEGFVNNRDVFASSYNAGEPKNTLQLGAISREDSWKIILEVHRKQGKTVGVRKEDALNALSKIDPSGRPLFAFIVGMALAEGEEIKNWNIHDLLKNLLSREEREIWSKSNKWNELGETHKNLVVLTTLTRSISKNLLHNIYLEKHAWFKSLPVVEIYDKLSQVQESKEDVGDLIFKEMEPDIVGEYFILENLSNMLREFDGTNAVRDLIQTAWVLKPEETRYTVERILRDFENFPHHLRSAYKYLWTTLPPQNSNEQVWSEWGWLWPPLSYYPLSTIDVESINAQLQKGPVTDLLKLQIAASNLGAIVYYCMNNQWDDAESKFKQIEELSNNYKKDEELFVCQIKGVYNLLMGYVYAKDWEMCEKKLNYIKDLAISSHNEIVKNHYSMALKELTLVYLKERIWNFIDSKYNQLLEFALLNPDTESVISNYADTVNNLIYYYGENGKLASILYIKDNAFSLLNQYSHSKSITYLFASIKYNIFYMFMKEKDLINFKIYYDELLDLVSSNLEDQKMITLGAKSIYYYVRFLGDNNKLNEAIESIKELEEFLLNYSFDTDAWFFLARACYDWLYYTQYSPMEKAYFATLLESLLDKYASGAWSEHYVYINNMFKVLDSYSKNEKISFIGNFVFRNG
ncbi:hypothetical protein GCM10028818_07130 [Spirosoma horti]